MPVLSKLFRIGFVLVPLITNVNSQIVCTTGQTCIADCTSAFCEELTVTCADGFPWRSTLHPEENTEINIKNKHQ